MAGVDNSAATNGFFFRVTLQDDRNRVALAMKKGMRLKVEVRRACRNLSDEGRELMAPSASDLWVKVQQMTPRDDMIQLRARVAETLKYETIPGRSSGDPGVLRKGQAVTIAYYPAIGSGILILD